MINLKRINFLMKKTKQKTKAFKENIEFFTEVVAYSMVDVAQGVEACRVVVAGLVEFMRVHGNNKASGGCTGAGGSPAPGEHTKYKVSLCRDLIMKGTCPRGSACTFAHSGDELDK